MDVVAVGDVALVSDALDDAEAALEGLRELVRGGLERRAVQREVDVGGFLAWEGGFLTWICFVSQT